MPSTQSPKNVDYSLKFQFLYLGCDGLLFGRELIMWTRPAKEHWQHCVQDQCILVFLQRLYVMAEKSLNLRLKTKDGQQVVKHLTSRSSIRDLKEHISELTKIPSAFIKILKVCIICGHSNVNAIILRPAIHGNRLVQATER